MRWLGVLFGVMVGALGVSAATAEVPLSQPVVFVDDSADSDLDVLVVRPHGQGPERRVEMPGDWPAVLDHPAWSPTGEALVVSGSSGSEARLFEVDLTVPDPEPVELVAGRGPSWAPDGHRLAYEDDSGALAVYDAREGSVTRLVSAERHESYECPAWSPDGSQVAARLRSDDGSVEWHTEVIIVDPDRPDQARSLHSEEGGVSCLTWAPDSGRLAFSDPRSRIHILDLEGRVVGGVDGPDCAIDQSPDWGPSGILFSRSFFQPPPVTLYDGDLP